MENLVDKMGFFDFFNHIIVGMYTIIGVFFILYQFNSKVSQSAILCCLCQTEINSLFLIICIFLILAISYSIGLVCHELFSILDTYMIKSLDNLMKSLFSNNSCITNEKKKERYKTLAKEIFNKNEIKFNKLKNGEISWNKDLAEYFFVYCLYQVQIRGLNKKSEKLRDIDGLARAFCISNALLLATLVLCGMFYGDNYFLSIRFFISEFVLLMIMILMFNRYRRKALRNRVLMTFSLYESIHDMLN